MSAAQGVRVDSHAVKIALSDDRRRDGDAVIEATRCELAGALADRGEIRRRITAGDWEEIDADVEVVPDKPITLQ